MANYINDQEIIKKTLEDQRKQMKEFAESMTKLNGRNIDSTYFSVTETPNGPAIGIKGKFDPFHLPDGWQYEPSYLLDSNYPKEGFYRMKDGKREFMPIENIEDRSIVVEYRDIIDVRSALLSANPYINTDQVQADPQTGAILLIGLPNDNVRMPQGLEMQDGFIVDINDYGKKFEIKRTLAHDYYNSINAGYSTTNMKDQAYHDEGLSKYKQKENDLTMADVGLLNFDDMRNIYERHAKSKNNTLETRDKNDSYKDIDSEQVNSARDKSQYQLAEIWVKSYELASHSQNAGEMAFSGENTEVVYNACMSAVMNCQGKNLLDVAGALYYVNGFENTGMIKTVLYFVSNPQISSMFQINTNGMTPESAIQVVENMREDQLHATFANTFGPIRDRLENRLGLDLEDDMSEGMQKQGPMPNNQTNRY